MKKILFSALAVFAFASEHGKINDPGLQLINQGNIKGALEVFKKECNQDKNGWACGNVGIILYKGMAGKKDEALAKKYYNKGCEMHDIGSCKNLGDIAYVEQNLVTAKGYFQKVCNMKKYIKKGIDSIRDVEEGCKRAKEIK